MTSETMEPERALGANLLGTDFLGHRWRLHVGRTRTTPTGSLQDLYTAEREDPSVPGGWRRPRDGLTYRTREEAVEEWKQRWAARPGWDPPPAVDPTPAPEQEPVCEHVSVPGALEGLSERMQAHFVQDFQDSRWRRPKCSRQDFLAGYRTCFEAYFGRGRKRKPPADALEGNDGARESGL